MRALENYILKLQQQFKQCLAWAEVSTDLNVNSLPLWPLESIPSENYSHRLFISICGSHKLI